MYTFLFLASNEITLIHWHSFGICQPRPTVPVIFLHGFSVLPSAREFLLPLATVHLVLFPLT